MVCTAKDLLEWKDFPKELRVLLLDKDTNYASEIRSKLEGMDYIVSMFCNEDEALMAAQCRPNAFHVAIVEVSTIDYDGSFKFLQMAKGLPTIMIASVQCLNTAMKCISLGAVEVLNKPLLEEKLQNIWQHVVHKAYNAGRNSAAESPRLVKELISPMVKGTEPHDELMEELPCLSDNHCDDEELDRSSGNDKYAAPSTPQLKQVRLSDDSYCQNGTNWCTEKDSAEHYEESKSVETTCFNTAAGKPVEADNQMQDCAVKEESDSAEGCKSESDTSTQHKNQPDIETSWLGESAQIQNTQSDSRSTRADKMNRKKMKVDWTTDLHKKFVQAVEQLGIDQAIPSRILELMKVEGLTRHNVASHLQKYRMHRRHTLPKRDERKLYMRPKDTMQHSYYYQQKPIVAYPPVQQPYHSDQTFAANQAPYAMWVHPGSHTAAVPAWGTPYQTWPWKSYTAMQAEAWGCPIMPAPQGSYSYYPQQNVSAFYGGMDDSPHRILSNFHNDHHLAEEVIDKTVKEAINKPWLRLPLGLKPPSTESVLSELSKQGISKIPPHSYQNQTSTHFTPPSQC